MAGTDRTEIKPGDAIVDQFVDSLSTNNSLDALTVTAIQQLHKTDRLTKPRLLQALDEIRSSALKTTQVVERGDS